MKASELNIEPLGRNLIQVGDTIITLIGLRWVHVTKYDGKLCVLWEFNDWKHWDYIKDVDEGRLLIQRIASALNERDTITVECLDKNGDEIPAGNLRYACDVLDGERAGREVMKLKIKGWEV